MPPTRQTMLAAAKPALEPTVDDGLDATVSGHQSASADDTLGAKGAALGAAFDSAEADMTIVATLQRELEASESRTHTAEEALSQSASEPEALPMSACARC